MKDEAAILKGLGPVPFWRGEAKCLDALRRMYERAMESALRREMCYNSQSEVKDGHS